MKISPTVKKVLLIGVPVVIALVWWAKSRSSSTTSSTTTAPSTAASLSDIGSLQQADLSALGQLQSEVAALQGLGSGTGTATTTTSGGTSTSAGGGTTSGGTSTSAGGGTTSGGTGTSAGGGTAGGTGTTGTTTTAGSSPAPAVTTFGQGGVVHKEVPPAPLGPGSSRYGAQAGSGTVVSIPSANGPQALTLAPGTSLTSPVSVAGSGGSTAGVPLVDAISTGSANSLSSAVYTTPQIAAQASQSLNPTPAPPPVTTTPGNVGGAGSLFGPAPAPVQHANATAGNNKRATSKGGKVPALGGSNYNAILQAQGHEYG